MQLEKFRGVTVAHITPFDKNKNIDEPKLRELIDRQIDGGTDVILSCGTTGESVTLSPEEQQIVHKITISQSNGRVPVLCGAGTNDTRDAIKLVEAAEKCGADAILSVAPYYNKPTQEGLYQHFKAIAAATSLPVILYNVPGRTGCNISAQTTLRLSEIENIVGIKEASGNFSQIMEIIRLRPEGFLVLSGDDSISLPIISLGGDGTVSVVANETPALFSQMVHSALDGNWDNARKLHNKLLPLMEGNFIESSPIPVKTAMVMMGLIEEEFRLPMVPMSPANKEKLRSILRDTDLI